MHILLTNDDGINAIGLKKLAEAILARGHSLLVCAPQTQQSAASQRLTMWQDMDLKSVPWENAEAYALAGSPADCARIGCILSKKPIDFVFSGINDGDNAGSAVYYSGTVAAAREARMLFLRSMAVSVCPHAAEESLAFLADVAVRLAERTVNLPWPRMGLINLNAPALPPDKMKPLRFAPFSSAFFLDEYERAENADGTVSYQLKKGLHMEPHAEGTDIDLLNKGHITCTFLDGFGENNAVFASGLKDFCM